MTRSPVLQFFSRAFRAGAGQFFLWLGTAMPPTSEPESLVFFMRPYPEPHNNITIMQTYGSQMVSDPNTANPVPSSFKLE